MNMVQKVDANKIKILATAVWSAEKKVALTKASRENTVESLDALLRSWVFVQDTEIQ